MVVVVSGVVGEKKILTTLSHTVEHTHAALSLTHIHAHTHSHSHTYTHTHIHAHTHARKEAKPSKTVFYCFFPGFVTSVRIHSLIPVYTEPNSKLKTTEHFVSYLFCVPY